MSVVLFAALFFPGLSHEVELAGLRAASAVIQRSGLAKRDQGGLLQYLIRPGMEMEDVESVLGPSNGILAFGSGISDMQYDDFGLAILCGIAHGVGEVRRLPEPERVPGPAPGGAGGVPASAPPP